MNSIKKLNKNLYLASPRGFCAGVERAIKIVEKTIEIYGKPVYVNHEIVHNKHVVKRLSDDGAIFVKNLSEVPKGSNVIFSAHGVSKKVSSDAKDNNLIVFDATCPLVTKVHLEALKLYKTRAIVSPVPFGKRNRVNCQTSDQLKLTPLPGFSSRGI